MRMLSAQGQAPVTPEHGAAVAKDIGAGYRECSAKTGKGVKEVFDAALRESLKGRWGRTIKQRKCIVM
jgi:Rho family protein